MSTDDDLSLNPEELGLLIGEIASRHNVSVDEAREALAAGLRHLDQQIMEQLGERASAREPVRWSDSDYLRDYMRIGPSKAAEKYGLGGPRAAAKMARKAGRRHAAAIDKSPESYRGIITAQLEEVYRDLSELGRPGDPRVAETQRRLLTQMADLNAVKRDTGQDADGPSVIRVEFRLPGERDHGEVVEIPAESPENAVYEIVESTDPPSAPDAPEGDEPE